MNDKKILQDYEYYRTENGVLYCGDCLEILPLIDEKIDFSFADPPYGINKADWDSKYDCRFIEILEQKTNSGEITCGDNNILNTIQRMKSYKGIFHNFNINGMTFSKIGFENVITGILYGNIKRGQNYIEFSICGKMPDHPSPKPINMLIKTIIRFTDKTNLILDPFFGSGTTGVACERLGRRWIGIEISEKYCEIAKQRISAENAQLKIFKD